MKYQDLYEVLTPSGWQSFDGVNRKKSMSVDIFLSNNMHIYCSLDHTFIIDGKERKASGLKVKEKLGNNLIVNIKLHKSIFVYDMVNVDDGNLYFHDSGIISHNCEFLGSSRQLLTAAVMSRLSPTTPIKIFKDEYEGLKIYQPPKKDGTYTMTVDVSRGRHLDASAFTIFDISEYPHRIVATYNNKAVAPLMYAGIIYQIAKQYNDAYILVEINDVGAQVAEELYYTYEYENLYWSKSGDQLGKKGADPYPGVRTTKKTKRIGCANLKDIVEKQQLIIDDHIAIQELSTFVQNDSGSWDADEGFNDDQVATLWLFAWLVMQPWFKDLTDKDIRASMYLKKIEEMEESLSLGFYSDGNEFHNEDTPESRGLELLI
jgi:hypothetical protein